MIENRGEEYLKREFLSGPVVKTLQGVRLQSLVRELKSTCHTAWPKKKYTYVEGNHFAVQQKLTQHCKSATFQLKKKKEG